MKVHYSGLSDCLPELQNMELEAAELIKRYPAAKIKRTSKDGINHIYIDTRKPPIWLRDGETEKKN